jgi:esterase/lipase superfamily enzyme
LEITTFFSTNRKATGKAAPEGFFGADRQQDLQFGKTVVSIPTVREPGTLNLPSLWKFEQTADPNKHFIFKHVIPLATEAVMAELSKAIGDSSNKSLLIFVHGYNVSFADAALRTAQLAHDLSFPGTAIFFSWPSAATARGYWRDEETVQLSQPAFDEFLENISNLGASEIYLIAHSMGNRLVANVLKDRAAKGKSIPNLRELFLAAPDINVELFREVIAPGLAALEGVHRTIYASSSDLALQLSKVVHQYKRVGDTEGGVQTFTGFETIDASDVAPIRRAFGHSYVIDSPEVLVDIAETLTKHFTADQRNLHRLGSPPTSWWLFK